MHPLTATSVGYFLSNLAHGFKKKSETLNLQDEYHALIETQDSTHSSRLFCRLHFLARNQVDEY